MPAWHACLCYLAAMISGLSIQVYGIPFPLSRHAYVCMLWLQPEGCFLLLVPLRYLVAMRSLLSRYLVTTIAVVHSTFLMTGQGGRY